MPGKYTGSKGALMSVKYTMSEVASDNEMATGEDSGQSKLNCCQNRRRGGGCL